MGFRDKGAAAHSPCRNPQPGIIALTFQSGEG